MTGQYQAVVFRDVQNNYAMRADVRVTLRAVGDGSVYELVVESYFGQSLATEGYPSVQRLADVFWLTDDQIRTLERFHATGTHQPTAPTDQWVYLMNHLERMYEELCDIRRSIQKI
jgi:cyanate lyase